MKKIQYHYTNTAKQLFIGVAFLYTLLRFLVMLEIIIFKIDGYYEATNIPLTILLYAVLFTLVIAVFRGHRFCYSLYDDNRLIYKNTLLRKQKVLDLNTVNLAVLDTFGVKFYKNGDADAKKDKPDFFLPFFRDGIIEAVHIDKFYRMLKEREDIHVVKNFTVLPGYSKKWRFVTIGYGILAFSLFLNCITPLTAVIVLFQNH